MNKISDIDSIPDDFPHHSTKNKLKDMLIFEQKLYHILRKSYYIWLTSKMKPRTTSVKQSNGI